MATRGSAATPRSARRTRHPIGESNTKCGRYFNPVESRPLRSTLSPRDSLSTSITSGTSNEFCGPADSRICARREVSHFVSIRLSVKAHKRGILLRLSPQITYEDTDCPTEYVRVIPIPGLCEVDSWTRKLLGVDYSVTGGHNLIPPIKDA